MFGIYYIYYYWLYLAFKGRRGGSILVRNSPEMIPEVKEASVNYFIPLFCVSLTLSAKHRQQYRNKHLGSFILVSASDRVLVWYDHRILMENIHCDIFVAFLSCNFAGQSQGQCFLLLRWANGSIIIFNLTNIQFQSSSATLSGTEFFPQYCRKFQHAGNISYNIAGSVN